MTIQSKSKVAAQPSKVHNTRGHRPNLHISPECEGLESQKLGMWVARYSEAVSSFTS